MHENDLLSIRLSNQRLQVKKCAKATDTVLWFGAMQAQDYQGAKWGIGQRIDNATDTLLENAFAKGDILRTHVMRPTWHFVHPADIRWMLHLTGPRVSKTMGSYNKMLQLDKEIFTKAQKVFGKALQGHKALTRQELKDELDKANIQTNVQRLAHIVMQAELDGVVCSGPRIGKQFTYMLLEERVPKAKVLSMDEALFELTKRYFQSHGPATLRDFVWWSGLASSDAKKGISMLEGMLIHTIVNDKVYWLMADQDHPSGLPAILHLLPNYDEYGIGYTERESFFHPAYTKLLDTRGNAIFQHAIVFAGRFIGTWRRTLKRDTVIISPTFFDKLTEEISVHFKKAADDFGKFLNLRVIIQ